MSNDVKSRTSPRLRALAAAALALGAAACGDLDNVTTVKDLRVLAVKSEPAGFLVPLDDPGSLMNTTAKLTALVVDPLRPSDILTLTGEGCPDFVDTITTASGRGSKLCPPSTVTDQLPPPLDVDLATTRLPPGTAVPVMGSTIEYDPQVVYGLAPAKLADFFVPSPATAMIPSINQAILYNRDFSLDAIVSLSFTIGDETASAIKRVVYWPLLPPDLVPAGTDCSGAQRPNTNPELTGIGFFHHRVEGIPSDEYGDPMPATVSITGDELYVQPTFDPAMAEHYLLRVKNADTGLVETQCRKELITFQFFATAGTFSPAERTSELSPLLTAPDNGHIPIDSQWKAPKPDKVPSDGVVTIWVVARDERAGAAWSSRKLVLQP
jgi:hypothetical protein